MAIRKMNWGTDTEQDLDIRGWTLKDDQGAELGRIEDLLVDSAAGKIRYAVASVPRRVLLPVGLLELDETSRSMTARGYTRELLVTLSEYEEGELSGIREHRHYAETIRPDIGRPREYDEYVKDYTEVQQQRRTPDIDLEPVRYEHEHYRSRNDKMQQIEERFRAIEARRGAKEMKAEPVRELSFSGTEPTDADFRERERLEGLRTVEDTTRKPKTTINIVPIDEHNT